MRRTLYNHTRGFTLLEVILGLGIASLVIGGIFAIAGGALDLSARTQRLRLEETRHTKLDQLFRQTFANLKPESQLVVSGGQHLIISKPGAGLTWPGSTPSAEILATYLRPVYTTTCRAARSIWRGSDVVNRSCSFLLLPAEMIRNHLELPKKVEQATTRRCRKACRSRSYDTCIFSPRPHSYCGPDDSVSVIVVAVLDGCQYVG